MRAAGVVAFNDPIHHASRSLKAFTRPVVTSNPTLPGIASATQAGRKTLTKNRPRKTNISQDHRRPSSCWAPWASASPQHTQAMHPFSTFRNGRWHWQGGLERGSTPGRMPTQSTLEATPGQGAVLADASPALSSIPSLERLVSSSVSAQPSWGGLWGRMDRAAAAGFALPLPVLVIKAVQWLQPCQVALRRKIAIKTRPNRG